ncbi:MAG: metallophosphoesterase [Conexibacter sp.]
MTRRVWLSILGFLILGTAIVAVVVTGTTGGGADRSATLWAVGDGATGSPRARRVARLIERGDPSRFLYLGDVYEQGTAEEFRSAYETVYGPLREVTLPTPGNHEWANRTDGYYPYWARTFGARPLDHYSVRVADWQLLSLNSEEPHEAGSRQVEWLERQVRGGGDCRIAFWHRPRFSAGAHGDQPDVEPLWQALVGRAVLVLSGHDHDMQELRVRDGIRVLIAGAGGNVRYPVDANDPRLAWGNDTTDGALRVRLQPGLARYDFVAVDGTILRSGAVRCRLAKPS